jgi:hypothetical protein
MISVLFVAKKSVYKTLTDSTGEPLDCWDEDRDALKWPGGNPVVAHPPCRLFCQMRHLSCAPTTEKRLAHFAVEQVRKWGGVLEHPAMTTLWKEAGLPRPGCSDQWGVSVAVNQWWWGHLARKSTWLYICGTKSIPEMPFRIGEAEFTCGHAHGQKKESHNWGSARSATPPAFACWLVETAERCQVVTK